MALPRAVQAKIDEANRIQAELSGSAEAPVVENAEMPVEIAEPAVTEPEQLEPPLEATTPSVDWEHKYKSETGQFKAAAERANQAAREAWEQVRSLQGSVEELRQRLDQKPAPAPEPELPGITNADVEALGSETVEFVQRAVAKALSDAEKVRRIEMQALYRALEETRGHVGGVEQHVVQSAEHMYRQELVRLIPDLDALVAHPAFEQWRNEEEGFSGYARAHFLALAHNAHNAQQVSKILSAFRSVVTPQAAAPAAAPTQNAELQRQLSPPKSKAQSATTGNTAQAKVWTDKEITKFYADKVARRYTDEQAARIQADIDSAVADGRVRL